ATACTGLNVFQHTSEGDIDLSRPILGQRTACYFSSWMCKPLVVKKPIRWSLGFHTSEEKPVYARHLYLFHLKSMDRNMALARLQFTRKMQWSQHNIDHKISEHHRADDHWLLHDQFNNPSALFDKSSPADLQFNFDTELHNLSSSL